MNFSSETYANWAQHQCDSKRGTENRAERSSMGDQACVSKSTARLGAETSASETLPEKAAAAPDFLTQGGARSTPGQLEAQGPLSDHGWADFKSLQPYLTRGCPLPHLWRSRTPTAAGARRASVTLSL